MFVESTVKKSYGYGSGRACMQVLNLQLATIKLEISATSKESGQYSPKWPDFGPPRDSNTLYIMSGMRPDERLLFLSWAMWTGGFSII